MFAGTLRDNVTLGVERSDDDVLHALRAVGAEVLVERFDDGLDHVIEEAGRTLSAGERQLLSFARALIVNPPILILDEATASIDTRRISRFETSGRMSSRYASSCASKRVVLGIDTTSVPMP